MTNHYFAKVTEIVGSRARWIRLVVVNSRITVRMQSAIFWVLYTKGKHSTATKRLGLGLDQTTASRLNR